MSESTTGKTVHFSIDFDNPPALTKEQEARLDRLAEMKDEDIDFSDIPSQAGKTGWVRGNLRERIAQRIAEQAAYDASNALAEGLSSVQEKVLRLDADVIELFQQVDDPSPAKMNAVLREYAVAHRKSA